MSQLTEYERLSHQRKQLQRELKAPNWLSTAGYQLLKERNYLDTAENPIDMYRRIARRAAELTKVTIPHEFGYHDWNEAFFDVMWKGWMSPSTPVLTNMGNDRGHPVACSGSYLGDSIRSWYTTRREMAQLTQRGYGTSTVLDSVRPRGSAISKGGTANGVMQPATGIVEDMKQVSQGSSRRGAAAMYLNPLHSDFDEVADQILADDDGWNIGWVITDEFNELFIKDPKRADEIWKKMLRTKLIKGKGYFFFVDKVNRHSPQMYKDRGFKVQGSNLCVTGDTKILTENGYIDIQTVAGTTQNIWDGKEWVKTPIFQTSKGQKILTVKFDNTLEIKATPYHRWYIKDGYKDKPIIKRTEELCPGDKLVKFDLEPIPHGPKTLDLAYVNGFHTGDGTVYKENNKARISLHDNKQLLKSRFSGYYNSSYTKNGRILNLVYKANVLKDKFFIPNSDYTVDSRIKWLEGYLDADGTLTNNNGTESIQVASIELKFLQNLLLMLQELGIHSTITKVKDAGYTKLPANDGSNTLKDYWTKDTYRLVIAGGNLNHLLSLGYTANRVQPTKRKYQREARQFIKIQSIIDNNEIQPTYCGTNVKNETLILNSVQTLNCSEIQLMSDENHSFTCVLTSMNIAKFDEWKDTKAIEIAMVFLDAIIEDMLIKAKQEPGFERVIAFTEKSRAVGLGVLGLSTYYQDHSWVFGDLQSMAFNHILTKLMDERSLSASKWLASELGEPEWLKGYGERFSHRMAFPPTMSTSIIQGGISQGIEPVFANVFEQDTAGGKVYRINPTFLKLMKERGMYTPEVMKRISEDQGSVQAEDWLTDHEKAVFRTAFEVSQETILRMASERQKYIDQGQSINLYFPADVAEEEVSRIHDIAFNDEYIEGLYYIRTLNGATKVKVPTSNCESCEG